MSAQIIPKKDLPGINTVKVSEIAIDRINKELERMVNEEVVSLGFIIYKMKSDEARAIVQMLKKAGYDCEYIEEHYADDEYTEYCDHDIEVVLV